jgi:hypothetical protein
MEFGGSAMSSVNSSKIYIQMWFCSQRHISNTMRGSLFQFFIPNYHFYQTDLFPGRKGRTAIAV